MSIRLAAAGFALAAGLLAAVPADAGMATRIVRGRLVSVSDGHTVLGHFQLMAKDGTSGSHFEKIAAFARHLGTPASGEFHLFLVSPGDTPLTADFGAMHVSASGNVSFHWDSRHDTMPGGVTTIEAFGGGTIEVRDGDNALVRGNVPDFINLTGHGNAGAIAFGHDVSRLLPVDASSPARGIIIARHQSLRRGTFEELRLMCARLDNGATYTAVAIASDTTETTLGTFTTSDPLGIGGFRLATRRGDTIPGGGVLALSGQDVEIRDDSNTAVLKGKFPTIQ